MSSCKSEIGVYHWASSMIPMEPLCRFCTGLLPCHITEVELYPNTVTTVGSENAFVRHDMPCAANPNKCSTHHFLVYECRN